MPGPELEFAQVTGHGVDVLPPVVAGGCVTCGRVREAAIELAFGPKGLAGTHLAPAAGFRDQAFRPNRSVNGRRIVPGQEASLQLGDPIPELAGDKMWLALKMCLHPELVKPPVIERAELTSQAKEVSDEAQPEWWLRPM